MTALTWDKREFSYGIERVVLQVNGESAVAWNGVSSVADSSETTRGILYVDGLPVIQKAVRGSFSGEITSHTLPDQLSDLLELSRRKPPGNFSYKVNDLVHLVYNAYFTINEKTYDREDPSEFVISVETTPRGLSLGTTHMIIDVSESNETSVSQIFDILYGSDTSDPRIPTDQEIFDIFEANSTFLVVDNGDGTFTVTAPSDMLVMLAVDRFELTSDSIRIVDPDTYRLRSG
jgi:hypothetical protein